MLAGGRAEWPNGWARMARNCDLQHRGLLVSLLLVALTADGRPPVVSNLDRGRTPSAAGTTRSRARSRN